MPKTLLFVHARLFVLISTEPPHQRCASLIRQLPGGRALQRGGRRRAGVPEHAVFGEEEGMACGAGAAPSSWLWVLDPIDGTKSFITGGAARAAGRAALQHARGQLQDCAR